jgi:hypothetical protein
MKKYVTLALLVTIVFNSCVYSERVRGSGNIVTFEEKFTDFTELNFSNAIEAEVEYGDDFQIVISIDDNLQKYVEISKRGNKLLLGLTPNVSYSNTNFVAHITMPLLTKLEASGASEIKFSGFKNSQDMTVDVSGATELEGFINIENLYLELSGASEVELVGSAKTLKISGSGASELDLSDFKTMTASVNLSGASEVDINVVESLSVDLSGASEVNYWGRPRLTNISTSGASSIKSMDR